MAVTTAMAAMEETAAMVAATAAMVATMVDIGDHAAKSVDIGARGR
jgi:hypothetical protein